MKKENEKIAIDMLDILSGIWGNDPKSNFVKGKLRKEIEKTHGRRKEGTQEAIDRGGDRTEGI